MSNVAKSAPYSADAELAPRKVIAAWGVIGGRQNRCASVLEMISGFDLICLKKTKEGYPSHPLYVAADTEPTRYER